MRELITLALDGVVCVARFSEAGSRWRVSFGFSEGICMSQWYAAQRLEAVRGTFSLLSPAASWPLKKQTKSVQKLKCSTSYEQPLVSPLFYSVLGGQSALAQPWPIHCSLWLSGQSQNLTLLISFFLMVNGIKDQARCVHICVKVCRPKGEEQLSK